MKLCRSLPIVLLSWVLLWTGCIPSVNPIYTEKDLVFEEALLGEWGERDKPNEGTRFERGEGKKYKMSFTSAEGKTSVYDAHLVRLGGVLFLDTVPNEQELKGKAPEEYSSHLIVGHYFFRVKLDGGKLQLAMLTGDAIEKHSARLRIQEPQGGESCITASTKELQRFLKRYGKDASVWEADEKDFLEKR